MKEEDKFLGCFTSGPAIVYDPNKTEEERLIEQEEKSKTGDLFRSYIWGEKGISNVLKKLKNKDYGNDMSIILFQFYINPIPHQLQHLKPIENYRKSEKSIGIPIIITDENFFSKSEEGRYNFLKRTILEKLDLLAEVTKKKKLDTKMDLLKADLQKLLV